MKGRRSVLGIIASGVAAIMSAGNVQAQQNRRCNNPCPPPPPGMECTVNICDHRDRCVTLLPFALSGDRSCIRESDGQLGFCQVSSPECFVCEGPDPVIPCIEESGTVNCYAPEPDGSCPPGTRPFPDN
jgi:hypothetical protein